MLGHCLASSGTNWEATGELAVGPIGRLLAWVRSESKDTGESEGAKPLARVGSMKAGRVNPQRKADEDNPWGVKLSG